MAEVGIAWDMRAPGFFPLPDTAARRCTLTLGGGSAPASRQLSPVDTSLGQHRHCGRRTPRPLRAHEPPTSVASGGARQRAARQDPPRVRRMRCADWRWRAFLRPRRPRGLDGRLEIPDGVHREPGGQGANQLAQCAEAAFPREPGGQGACGPRQSDPRLALRHEPASGEARCPMSYRYGGAQGRGRSNWKVANSGITPIAKNAGRKQIMSGRTPRTPAPRARTTATLARFRRASRA